MGDGAQDVLLERPDGQRLADPAQLARAARTGHLRDDAVQPARSPVHVPNCPNTEHRTGQEWENFSSSEILKREKGRQTWQKRKKSARNLNKQQPP